MEALRINKALLISESTWSGQADTQKKKKHINGPVNCEFVFCLLTQGNLFCMHVQISSKDKIQICNCEI